MSSYFDDYDNPDTLTDAAGPTPPGSSVGVIDVSQNSQYVGGAYVANANYNPTLFEDPATDSGTVNNWWGTSNPVVGVANDIDTAVSGQPGGLWDSLGNMFGNVLDQVGNAIGQTAGQIINRAGQQATGAINSAAPRTNTGTPAATNNTKTIALLAVLALAVGVAIYYAGKKSE